MKVKRQNFLKTEQRDVVSHCRDLVVWNHWVIKRERRRHLRVWVSFCFLVSGSVSEIIWDKWSQWSGKRKKLLATKATSPVCNTFIHLRVGQHRRSGVRSGRSNTGLCGKEVEKLSSTMLLWPRGYILVSNNTQLTMLTIRPSHKSPGPHETRHLSLAPAYLT